MLYLNDIGGPQLVLWVPEGLQFILKKCYKHGTLNMLHRKLAVKFFSERSEHAVPTADPNKERAQCRGSEVCHS